MIKIDFLGLKCGVCEKSFEEGDDVVVCPECGTPVHRSCYKEHGGCPNADKHGTDFVFEEFDKIKKSAQGETLKKQEKNTKDKDEKIDDSLIYGGGVSPIHVSVRKEVPCPYCGEMNKAEANYCNKCGAKFAKIQPVPVMETGAGSNQTPSGSQNPFTAPNAPVRTPYSADPLAGVAAGAMFEEDVTAVDLANFTAVNTPYYMKAFAKYKKKIKSFNLSACVFSGLWFLYRKLYKVGSFIFSLELVLYAARFYIQQTYSMSIMTKLLESVGADPEKSTMLTFEQYMNMSNELMTYSIDKQIMFMLPSFIFIFQLILMLVCGFIANETYYKHCVNKIKQIKNNAKEERLDESETAQAIFFSGGVNPFVAGACSLLYMFMFR